MALNQLSNGNSEGNSLGQSITDKISFYNVTPIVQRSGAAQAAVTTTLPAVTQFGYSLPQATALLNLVNEMRAALVAVGLIKGGT